MQETFFHAAAIEAEKALCGRAKCGAVIVIDGTIVGRGYNAPPGNLPEQRMCEETFTHEHKPSADLTCCMHAEWRAILDALKNTNDLSGGALYFTRVDKNGDILKSGVPYCTVCSRFALDVGLKTFGLWHESGIRMYDTKEYNKLSFAFHKK